MSPLCDNLKCAQCNCTEALFWKSIGAKQQLCNNCSEGNKTNPKQEGGETHRKTDERRIKLRKSTRSTRYGKNNGSSNNAAGGAVSSNSNKTSTTKSSGRGRRNLLRRPPIKSIPVPATTRNVKSLFYKGSYIQIGDIVSLCNSNFDKFYAQIRGLLIDNFCEKSAFLTWLLPTQSSPPSNDGFDPSTYVVGPEEDHPRLLACMEFVMHAPSDYYHDKSTPYPPIDSNPYGPTLGGGGGGGGGGFIWTNI